MKPDTFIRKTLTSGILLLESSINCGDPFFILIALKSANNGKPRNPTFLLGSGLIINFMNTEIIEWLSLWETSYESLQSFVPEKKTLCLLFSCGNSGENCERYDCFYWLIEMTAGSSKELVSLRT